MFLPIFSNGLISLQSNTHYLSSVLNLSFNHSPTHSLSFLLIYIRTSWQFCISSHTLFYDTSFVIFTPPAAHNTYLYYSWILFHLSSSLTHFSYSGGKSRLPFFFFFLLSLSHIFVLRCLTKKKTFYSLTVFIISFITLYSLSLPPLHLSGREVIKHQPHMKVNSQTCITLFKFFLWQYKVGLCDYVLSYYDCKSGNLVPKEVTPSCTVW